MELASQEVKQFGVDQLQGVCPYFLPTSATVYPHFAGYIYLYSIKVIG
jgi:hypothetical protein